MTIIQYVYLIVVGTDAADMLMTKVALTFVMATYVAEKIMVTIPWVHGNIDTPSADVTDRITETQID